MTHKQVQRYSSEYHVIYSSDEKNFTHLHCNSNDCKTSERIFLISLLSIEKHINGTEMNAKRCFVIAFVSIQVKTENVIFSYLPNE